MAEPEPEPEPEESGGVHSPPEPELEPEPEPEPEPEEAGVMASITSAAAVAFESAASLVGFGTEPTSPGADAAANSPPVSPPESEPAPEPEPEPEPEAVPEREAAAQASGNEEEPEPPREPPRTVERSDEPRPPEPEAAPAAPIAPGTAPAPEPEAPPEPAAEPEPESQPEPGSERYCRICYEGDREGDKLFSPCLCSGSCKYIHVSCLNTWRHQYDSNHRNFTECDLCHYKYRLYRPMISRLLLSPHLLLALSAVATGLFTLLCGLVAVKIRHVARYALSLPLLPPRQG